MQKHDKHQSSSSPHASSSEPRHPGKILPEAVAEISPIEGIRGMNEGGPTYQLEPDRIYVLEYYDPPASVWRLLASIDVTPTLEQWKVDSKAAATLGTVMDIRLRLAPTLPSIPNALPETTGTKVTWTNSTSPGYPSSGRTYAGPYTYAVGAGTTKGGTLAINIETSQVTGGAAIAVIFWYNPDPAPSPNPIMLGLSGGVVTMHHVTGAYVGACYTATSPKTY